ncbi:MAG: type II toxin-antitoxin system PemK/MazF family toxin [Vicinamibacterales bacterium]
MTRGKVVLVPFPFDDLATQKARPAVCLTEPITSHRHIVLAFVTSRLPDELLETDIVLDPLDPDFAQTGLQFQSTIRTHRLLTVASALIKRELGTLSPRTQSRVADGLRRLFALESTSVGGGKAEPNATSES